MLGETGGVACSQRDASCGPDRTRLPTQRATRARCYGTYHTRPTHRRRHRHSTSSARHCTREGARGEGGQGWGDQQEGSPGAGLSGPGLGLTPWCVARTTATTHPTLTHRQQPHPHPAVRPPPPRLLSIIHTATAPRRRSGARGLPPALTRPRIDPSRSLASLTPPAVEPGQGRPSCPADLGAVVLSHWG